MSASSWRERSASVSSVASRMLVSARESACAASGFGAEKRHVLSREFGFLDGCETASTSRSGSHRSCSESSPTIETSSFTSKSCSPDMLICIGAPGPIGRRRLPDRSARAAVGWPSAPNGGNAGSRSSEDELVALLRIHRVDQLGEQSFQPCGDGIEITLRSETVRRAETFLGEA
jgi:hypothetical protein